MNSGGPPGATPRLNLPLGLVPNPFGGSSVMALTFAGKGMGRGSQGLDKKQYSVGLARDLPDPKTPLLSQFF